MTNGGHYIVLDPLNYHGTVSPISAEVTLVHRYRQIVSHTELGDKVFKGHCLGRILYGSAVVLLLPDNCEITVKAGSKVTVVAKIADRI